MAAAALEAFGGRTLVYVGELPPFTTARAGEAPSLHTDGRGHAPPEGPGPQGSGDLSVLSSCPPAQPPVASPSSQPATLPGGGSGDQTGRWDPEGLETGGGVGGSGHCAEPGAACQVSDAWELFDGRTAGPQFHAMLARDWMLMRDEALPHWPLARDRLTVWARKEPARPRAAGRVWASVSAERSASEEGIRGGTLVDKGAAPPPMQGTVVGRGLVSAAAGKGPATGAELAAGEGPAVCRRGRPTRIDLLAAHEAMWQSACTWRLMRSGASGEGRSRVLSRAERRAVAGWRGRASWAGYLGLPVLLWWRGLT